MGRDAYHRLSDVTNSSKLVLDNSLGGGLFDLGHIARCCSHKALKAWDKTLEHGEQRRIERASHVDAHHAHRLMRRERRTIRAVRRERIEDVGERENAGVQ